MSKEDPTTNEPVMDGEDKLRPSSSEEVSPAATAQHSVRDDTTIADEKAIPSTAGGDTAVSEHAGDDVPAAPADEIVYPGMITKLGVGLGLSLAIFLVPKHPPHPKPNSPLGIVGSDNRCNSHSHHLGLL